jgi:O-antigen ligase/polysaccharide polymerase Wzy-like membrane protein
VHIIASVTVEASPPLVESSPRERDPAPPAPPRLETRIAAVALALLPGGMVVYFSFNAGGFFPSSVGFVALLVIQMLVLRVLVANQPFAGFTPRLAIVATVFCGFAAWTLLSQTWSDTQGRALIEFDRALLYLALLILFGLVPRARWRMPWILRGLAAGIVFVCACALITRVLPDVWPTAPEVSNNRLSFPLTYWNSLGLLAAIGAVLTLGIAANPSENRWARTLAAGAVPIVATTLFFTFSRGAMVALIVGLVAYLALMRLTALLAVLATVPPTIVAVVVAYNADVLATLEPTTPLGVHQGKQVALAVGICALAAALARLATLPVDRRIAARPRWPRQRTRAATAGAALFLIAIALAAGVPSWVSTQYDNFLHAPPIGGTDLRSRLTDVSSNGRAEHWRAALKGFSSAPVKGTGAGTYQFVWDLNRRSEVTVVDGHSLYFEVLGELGLPGLLLIVATVAAILVALAGRIRGPNRAVYAALFAAALTWALHAGVDWDWEMPAVTAWLFAVGGAALAARQPKSAPAPMESRARIPVAAALLVVAVTPTLLMLSQYRLDASAKAFEKNDCRQASSEAIKSINLVAVRPEPYQILGYCDLENGRPEEAVAAMRKAIEQQPRSWEYHYSLALAQGYAGIDPHPQLAVARRLNPREPLIDQALAAFRGSSPAGWLRAAQTLDGPSRFSGRLSLR